MIVFVGEQSAPQLMEPNDFGKFSVKIAAAKDRFEELRKLLLGAVEFDGESIAWVCADKLLEMSSVASDAAWRGELARMIEKARPHGWIRDDPKIAIKAHVVWDCAKSSRE